MVVMDVFTRRIVGFGVEPAHIDGSAHAACVIKLAAASPFPSASAPIMTPYSAFIVGARIFEFWTSRN